MHKYQPRIHIVKKKDNNNSSIQSLEAEEFRTFIFTESVFIAVTAYQNQLVSYKYGCVFTEHARLAY
jgi:T-box protein 20